MTLYPLLIPATFQGALPTHVPPSIPIIIIVDLIGILSTYLYPIYWQEWRAELQATQLCVFSWSLGSKGQFCYLLTLWLESQYWKLSIPACEVENYLYSIPESGDKVPTKERGKVKWGKWRKRPWLEKTSPNASAAGKVVQCDIKTQSLRPTPQVPVLNATALVSSSV